MKKKKHLYKIIGGILAFAVVIGSGALWIQGINGEYEAAFAKEQEEKETLKKEIDGLKTELKKKEFESIIDEEMGEENVVHSRWIDEWKSGERPFHENLVREVIQQMSHQKVIADQKEGSIMITQERIETLIRMVEENKNGYETADQYLSILNRWKEGNFNLVDNDHNEMWRLQERWEGRATGIASEEQEKDYLVKMFGVGEERN
ncbi:DUF6241 domain-containing protein [Cytobacillus horneckiae]|uniref:CTP synthase n=2 Tax=Cytobacillus horneckiae TaxID=549687 RepID=A0A2N0ZKL2_9BACI|nr:DUF6241 domain-containing protein [Cytobacillus horneckiae]MCM3180311.1 DUF6241 domain-containing protein [Cytobacillus horneckiae]MEC1156442.1 DUF6241 domain-containing protein [Cytobacillus horneckiae]MED2938459.1 DUF6241 domain-containing protein [Cytobacillus horneckiae]PKG30038.1 hypothetical protein CWS20_03320 [Cytobacillus horneckiae]